MNAQKRHCNYSCEPVEDVSACEDNEYLETACMNMYNQDCNYQDECSCGFDELESPFPENPVLAQSYVPIQMINRTFIPCVGLKMGTIYPELVSPYMPGQAQREIEYIKSKNMINWGCNKC